MKFQDKFPKAAVDEQIEFEGKQLVKGRGLGTCSVCGGVTRWVALSLKSHICSEECLSKAGGEDLHLVYRADIHKRLPWAKRHLVLNHEAVQEEINAIDSVQDASKDILIVVHNQLDYLRECVESIRATTKNYRLMIWDNGSDKETEDYLQSLESDGDTELMYCSQNLGFIQPNNSMAEWGQGEYLILLNSDTVVYEGWWQLMLGWLQSHPEVGEVGCLGGLLDENGIGGTVAFGYDIDYLMGWGICLRRSTYESLGFHLFSPQLQFAYAEDSDLSLRIQEAGHKIYGCYCQLVFHYGNATVTEVKKAKTHPLHKTFEHNHEYMRLRWKDYLENRRVMVRKK